MYWVTGVLGFILEELVDIFDPLDAVFARRIGKVAIVESGRLTTETSLVQRPLGQRNLERLLRPSELRQRASIHTHTPDGAGTECEE